MNPVLHLRDITVERRQRTILSNINWTIEQDQQWVLMGLNGSGKTSLLTLITGYQWPTQGHVSVLGQAFGTVDLRELRKRIGWVSHHLAEWMTRDHGHVSVRELVESGRDAVVGKGRAQALVPAVTAALGQFDLESLSLTPFATLSQGEKTRVLLARAWMAEVELLILDEPCSGLDIKGREAFLSLVAQYLKRAGRRIHLIYVTHHPEEILPGFTHALILKNGRVFSSGTLDQVLTDDTLSRAFDVRLTVQRLGGRPWVQVLPDTGQ